MEKVFLDEIEKNRLAALLVKPRWSKGDKVRVLKNLTENTCNVSEFLGEKCVVEDVNTLYGIFNGPRVEYLLRLNNRIEPFFEYELDARLKRTSKLNQDG